MTDDVRIRAEPARPESVRENDGAFTAGQAIGFGERPADRRRHAHRLEELGRDAQSAELRRVAVARQRHAGPEYPRHPIERSAGAPPIQEIGIGADVLVESLARVVGPQHHQPVGLRKRERPQQHRVHHRENRRVGADAERERQDDERVEERLLADVPDRVVDVGPHGAHLCLETETVVQSSRFSDGPASRRASDSPASTAGARRGVHCRPVVRCSRNSDSSR